VTRSKANCQAAFVLREAQALGIRVGTDGNELVMVAPLRIPRDVRRWFEHWLDQFRDEVIDIILRENAGRRA
jgi:hypothetical protein